MARNSGRTSGGTAGRPSRGKSEGVNYNEEQYYAQNAIYQQQAPAPTQHSTSSANISRQPSRQGGTAPTNGGQYDQAYAGGVNYQHSTGTLDPRFLQQQQQQHQAYAAPRRNSLSYPQQPGNAGIKDEYEDGDGDGDYEEPEEDDDGEYGAAPSRSASNKGKGKGTSARGKGKTAKASNGSTNKSRSSNSYKVEEDEEDDYVEEDDEEEGSYEDEDASEEEVPIHQVQSRGQPRASNGAAAVPAAGSAQVHPNFIPLSQMQGQQHLPPSNRRVNIRFSNGQRTATQSTIAVPSSHLQDAVSEADSQMTASSDAPHVTSNGHTYEAKYTAPTTATTSSKRKNKQIVMDSEEEEEEEDAEGESELPPSDALTVTANNIYAPSSLNDLPDIPPQVIVQEYKTHSGRRTLRKTLIESPGSSEDEETLGRGGRKRRGQSKQAKKYAGEDSDDGEGDYKDNNNAGVDGDGEYMNDERSKRKLRNARLTSLAAKRNGGRTTRSSARWDGDDDEDYEEPDNNRRGNGRRYSTESSDEEDGAPQFSDHTSDDDIMLAAKRGKEQDKNDSRRGYGLRRTNKVNYNLPTLFGLNPDGTAKAGPSIESQGTSKDKTKKKKSGYGGPSQHLPFNMSGRQLGSLFGEAPVDSSSDDDTATPRRGSASYGGTSGGAMSAGGGAGSMDFGYSGSTPNNLGKVSGATSKFSTLLSHPHDTAVNKKSTNPDRCVTFSSFMCVEHRSSRYRSITPFNAIIIRQCRRITRPHSTIKRNGSFTFTIP